MRKELYTVGGTVSLMDRPIYTGRLFPCLDCPDRSVKIIDGKPVRCHSYCEKYLAAKEKQRAEDMQIKDAARKEYAYLGYHLKKLRKIRKARRHD